MMLGLSLGPGTAPILRSRSASGSGTAPPVATIVIEGDSITSIVPSTPAGTFYSYRYADHRDDLEIAVRAQASRSVGDAGNLNDDGNTLMGHVAEDMAYEPDLLTVMIGANDMALNSAATLKANLATWYGAVKAERPQCRVAWSAPIPYNPDQSHPSDTNFTAQRAIVLADCRDPAVWGQWADHYLPMGEHPDFIADPPLSPSLWSDGVHPTGFGAINGTGGQNRLYDVFRAAVDTLADATRESAATPYESVWPGSETNLAPGVAITRRFIVSGIAHDGISGSVSVSGGDAVVRLNGGAWSDDTTGTSAWLYNGDVIDLRLTTSEAASTAVAVSLTIGGETRGISYTTSAAVEPVTYTHGNVTGVIGNGTTHTVGDADFAAGLALVAIERTALSVTLDGIPMAQLVHEGTGMQVYVLPLAAPLTGVDIAVTFGSWSAQSAVSYGSLQNADPIPVQTALAAPAHQPGPHMVGDLTIPANGLALLLFREYASAEPVHASAIFPGEQIDAGGAFANGDWRGMSIAKQETSGNAGFAFQFGTHTRLGIVFKAKGT